MWQSSTEHHRPSSTALSSTVPLPSRYPKRALGRRNGARFIDSMPPATYTSPSPALMDAAASMIDFSPDPHTRLIVVAGVVSARPAWRRALRAGACPAPACRTWPMRTSSIGASAGSPDRSTAARIATAPSSVAGTEASAPPNFPIGVRAADTRKTCPLGPGAGCSMRPRVHLQARRAARARRTMAAPTVRSGNAPMAAAGDSLPADAGDLDARRSDALTWLAPSIAHELANPLAAILTFAGFLARDPRLPADLRGDGRMLREEAERTHRLVRTLLEVARDRPPVMTVVEVVPTLDEVLELAGGATVGVELERVVASEVPGVDTDPARLRQLLVILTVEALRGLGDRPAGTLRVEVTPDPGGHTVLVRFEYRHRGGHGRTASGVPAMPTGETQVPSVGGTLLVEAEDDGGRLTLVLPIASARQAGAASRGS